MKIAIKKRTKATTMILSGLITAFGCSYGYASNQFADTPLYLQSKSIKKTGYNAKPNVLFLLDINMTDHDRSIKYKTLEEFHRALELTLEDTSNRKNFNFALYPTLSSCENSNFTPRPSCKIYKTIHDPDTLTGFNNLMEIIHGNNNKSMGFLDNEFKHVQFRTFPKVLRNVLMNKLEYRCQKPFLVFVKYGDSQWFEMFNAFQFFPVTDSTLSLQGRDYGYDGYFDGDSVRDDTMFKLGQTNNKYNALQYYTNTIGTKSFGNYIYTKDILSTEVFSDDDTEYLKSTKHSDRKLYDNAGKPWNEQDPNANLPWHNDKYTQTATTFVATIGQIPFSKYDTSKDVNQELLLRSVYYSSWKSYYDSKQQLLMNAASPRKNSKTEKNDTGRYYYSILNGENTIIGKSDEIQKALQNILDEIRKIGGNYIEVDQQQNSSFSPVMGSAIQNASNDTARKSVIIRVQTDSDEWVSKLCLNSERESNNENGNITCNNQTDNQTNNSFLGYGQEVYNWRYYSNNYGELKLSNDTFKIPLYGKYGDYSSKLNNGEFKDLLLWLNRGKEDRILRTTLVQRMHEWVNDINDKRPVWHQPFRIRKSDTNTIGDIIHNTIESTDMYVVTSANDGMVHVYKQVYNPSKPTYKAAFTFMPLSVERESTDGSDLAQNYFKDLTNVSYGKVKDAPHRYLLDGGLTLVKTPRIGRDGDPLSSTKPRLVFLVSNLGQAGRGAFAINIGGNKLTNGSYFDLGSGSKSPKPYKDFVLFQTPIGNDNEFGYTIGSPGVGITRVNRDNNAPTNTYTDHLRETAFINNGVNFPGKEISENESALFIYDILGVDVGANTNIDNFKKDGDKAGTLIKKLTATDGKGGLAGSVVYDINNDGIADLIYAGDYGGNLYRFDIRNPHPDNWSVTKIFKANGPITSAPTLFRPDDDGQNSKKNRIIVVFGTGSELYQSDLDNKDQQAIYGIYDEFDETGKNALVQSSDLLEQTMIYKDKNGELSSNKFLPEKHKGWYFKLNNDGERITSKINALLSTGMVISRSYNHEVIENKNTADANDPCLTGPSSESINVTSRIMQFDARNGGKLSDTSPRFRLPNVKVDETIQSSYEFDGALGMILTIVSNSFHQYNSLDAGRSGEQKIDPTGAFSKFENCYRGTDVNMHLSDGQRIKLENIPHCGIEFKSLAWREIKDGFHEGYLTIYK